MCAMCYNLEVIEFLLKPHLNGTLHIRPMYNLLHIFLHIIVCIYVYIGCIMCIDNCKYV